MRQFLDLGDMPLAGGFLETVADLLQEKTYPLRLGFDEESGLVSCMDMVDPKLLFTKYYYHSSHVPALVDHFKWYAMGVQDRKVLEIGGNDGVFCRELEKRNKLVVNVDPSSVAQGTVLYPEYFSSELAKEIRQDHGKFDWVTTSNCFAHTIDPEDIILGAKELLEEDRGIFVIEAHWLGDLIKNLQFPFIYHEHRHYLSLKAISHMLAKVGGKVFRVSHHELHGGTMRCYCSFDKRRPIEGSVPSWWIDEEKLGLNKFSTFLDYGRKVQTTAGEVRDVVKSIVSNGNQIFAYGASGQATILMNYCKLGKDYITAMIDDSPAKVGRLCPGTHVPIRSSEYLVEKQPKYTLLTAYTMRDSILERNPDYKGTWVIPLPEIEYVSSSR